MLESRGGGWPPGGGEDCFQLVMVRDDDDDDDAGDDARDGDPVKFLSMLHSLRWKSTSQDKTFDPIVVNWDR